MRAPASLRSRVFAAMAAVSVLPAAAALLFLTRQLTRQAELNLGRGLEEAARLVEQYHRAQVELAAERASLVADLPKLKAAVYEADARTVEPVARDYRERVGADVFVVADRHGRTLVTLGVQGPWSDAPPGVREPWSQGGRGRSGAEGGQVGAEGGRLVEFRVEGARLLEAVGAPIVMQTEPPERLGHLTLAFALDDAFLSRLRAITGSELAITQGGRVFGSTLPRALDAGLLALDPAPLGLDAGPLGLGTASRLWLEGDEYVLRRTRLGSQPDAPQVLVLRSRAEALRPLRTLRAALLAAALGAIVFGVLLSWAVARTVTRPLAALSAAMREIAATGDLARRIPAGQPWDDEDAKLLARTFGALTDSIARFQREAATRERLSALGRLSTVIAHEVRNPLMIIKGALRTLEGQGASPEDVREAAADIRREVARLNRIVADVLDFARPLRVESAPVDASALAREAARAVLDGSERVSARFALDASAGPIQTDGERLRAALVNVIENARDSALARRSAAIPAGAVAAAAGARTPFGVPAHGATPAADAIGIASRTPEAIEIGSQAFETIEIGSRALEAGRLLLWVEDRGLGIPAADVPHVFEPYFTTKRTGTGLGLAITRKVVDALGGSIRLESREGEGTRVEIELPPAAPAAATEAR